MTVLADTARNSAVNAITARANLASLHTVYPGSAGLLGELAGGSYARQSIAWGSAAAGAATLTGTETFGVPAATTGLSWVGFWEDGSPDVYLGCAPLSGGAAARTGSANPTSDAITAPGHGFSDGQTVTVLPIAGVAVPAGLTVGALYYVVSASTDTLQLATTSGGSAVNITAAGVLRAQRIIPETFNAAANYELTSASITIHG